MRLREALEQPGVFGHAFAGPSWGPWRTIAAGMDGLLLDEGESALWRDVTGRPEPPETPATELWVVAGRRSGKTRFAAAVATHAAISVDPAVLAPGEMGVALLCAVDQRQAQVALGYCRALLEGSPLLRRLIGRQTSDAIELKNRCRIEVRSSNYRSVRGLTLLACVVDEIAFLRDEQSAVPDVELVRAVRPGLSTTGGRLVCVSSPWAKRGVLWDRYRRHYGKPGKVLVVQAPSTLLHPGLDAVLIAEARADDAESAGAEWDGAFRGDLESFISTALVEELTAPGVTERPPRAGVTYYAFVDAASGTGRDSFTAAVAHGEERDGRHVAVLDAVLEVRPPFNPSAVVEEVAQCLARYGLTTAQSDAYAGGLVVDLFRKHDIIVTQDAPTRSELYLGFLPLASSRRVELLDDERLHRQLVGLERRRRAAGRELVDHPPNLHDDRANACVGALLLAAQPRECVVIGGLKRPRWDDATGDYVRSFRDEMRRERWG